MAHIKLHIPGPVEVSDKTFQAFRSPMIGHRGQGFKDLYAKMQLQLQSLFCTKQLVYLSTSSAWGVMEGAIRNLAAKKVLCCMCGAFSDKWLDVSKRGGKEAEPLQVDWGSPIRADAVDAKLATGQFDALTLIHNETSTGTMSPLAEIAALKKKYPYVMFIVDAVSSLSAIKIEFDALGIDVLLAGTQKALAITWETWPAFTYNCGGQKKVCRKRGQKEIEQPSKRSGFVKDIIPVSAVTITGDFQKNANRLS